jgi:alkylated DNA repair dioxygenase AlkB
VLADALGFFAHCLPRPAAVGRFYFDDLKGVVRRDTLCKFAAGLDGVRRFQLADGDNANLHAWSVRNAARSLRVVAFVAQQIGLFGAAPQTFVNGESSIVYHPALLDAARSTALFAHLERALPWTQETMWMYDRTVSVPRLLARFPSDEPLPEELASLKALVEERLDTRFNSLSVQYYRDGGDSVAWHSDHTEDLIDRPFVALVSLGAVREMQIRSKGKPRRSFSIDLEPGSLLVMGGLAQEQWEHHIPKVSRPIAPRISIALRQKR